jgi:general secretion pathway protein F
MPEGGELEPRPSGAITIDQLLALNAEIIALVRAGVPLERGLLATARELRGRLGRIASALGRRLSRGDSLVAALEGEGRAIPPLYRAVVEAGARSGRLPVALEGLARYVRGYSDARATIGLALWYPILVLSLAYTLFVGLVTQVVPKFITTLDSLNTTTSPVLHWLNWMGQNVAYWWPAGPIVLVLVAIAWIRSGSAARFRAPTWTWLRLFPWMKSILSSYESANFSELLALLLEHDVVYPDALVLAAEATANPNLIRGAHQLAEAITRGEPAERALRMVDQKTFLPMLRWVLATGQQQGSLVAALHNLSELYRKRGKYQAAKLSVFLPTILMLAIGASATLLYGLALFLPVINVLRELSVP